MTNTNLCEKLPKNSRMACSEGAVLLKNDGNVLPLKNKEKISIFGRTAFEYIKSGTGSGGRVNTPYVTGIMDTLLKEDSIELNKEVISIYEKFIEENPYDSGNGWAREPWFQKELDISEEDVIKAAKFSSNAIFVLGRLAGEAQDMKREKGGWLLQDEELSTLKTLKKHFKRVFVIINAGNVIDIKFIDELGIDGAMFIWHGGQEGGNAFADLLLGRSTPNGRLPDTIAKDISDYPSDSEIFDTVKNYYTEDIYVGYRYFETFCKDKVLYPFGFGLSYTQFELTATAAKVNNEITVEGKVKNVGNFQGREVLQVYYEAPQGLLGKPLRQLATFIKTPNLLPNEECTVTTSFKVEEMASYDDSGVTGNKSCYVLEAGKYTIYAGVNVREAKPVFDLEIGKTTVTKKCTPALCPVESFKRLQPKVENGEIVKVYNEVPTRSYDLKERIAKNQEQPILYTGDKGITFKDVKENKNTLDEFIAQFTGEELTQLFFGEGMNSPKIKSGCGGAFGGLTRIFRKRYVPAACVTDGPSGLRFDTGELASQVPIGTCIGATFDPQIAEDLYEGIGYEAKSYGVDGLLGPGINLHRHPLCGRNFEYVSEDPVLTSKIAVALCKGINHHNVSATIKHFACNNQEINRTKHNAVVSERALRECYLKCFEEAAKSGECDMIMTSYNQINGIHTSSSYDLNTTILRGEWGYKGFVMTDWWPLFNEDGDESNNNCKSLMVRAQNDINMVINNAEEHDDDIIEALQNGKITLYEVQRNAKNVLRYLLKSNAYSRNVENYVVGDDIFSKDKSELKVMASVEKVELNQQYTLDFNAEKPFVLRIIYTADRGFDMQSYVDILDSTGNRNDLIILTGTKNCVNVSERETRIFNGQNTISFGYNPKEIDNIKIEILQ